LLFCSHHRLGKRWPLVRDFRLCPDQEDFSVTVFPRLCSAWIPSCMK
jgi:hypothetical protein